MYYLRRIKWRRQLFSEFQTNFFFVQFSLSPVELVSGFLTRPLKIFTDLPTRVQTKRSWGIRMYRKTY